MPATLGDMAKKNTTADDAVPTTFRFRGDVRAALLEFLKDHSTSTVTHEIHEALRERLERLGYWPANK